MSVPMTYSGEVNNINEMLTAGMRQLANSERFLNIAERRQAAHVL